MDSPRHMTSSSPAPGQGPHPPRSGAPTPVPPRGASADPMMGMRPDGLRPDGLQLGRDQGMMRMNDVMVRGPDGQIRPGNDMMMMRDGRIMRDGMLPERAPSADGMPQPNMRSDVAIGRLGPDGTMVRGPGPMPYGQPSYGAQGGGFGQPGPGYVLHQTPAQQHQNMQMRNNSGAGVQRSGSVDDMPILSGSMSLPDEMGDMVPAPGPGRRTSMPPQMVMMNGVGPGPRPGPGVGPGPGGPGMAMAQRRQTISQSRPFPLGLGIVRMSQMSQEMSDANLTLEHWAKFRTEYFMPTGKISMTIFQGVEGRKYDVAPELVARFFLTFFEGGVSKMSLGLNGAKETSDESMSNLDSVVDTLQGVWRYELHNGWIVEHTGPLKVFMTAVPEQGPAGEQLKLKIQEMIFTAPVASHLFKIDVLDGNRVSGPAPMTPRISPGLAARKPEGGTLDELGSTGREDEMLVYENVRFPPKPFQKFGFPENVWRLLAMSACVHELLPVMELAHESQSGPIGALEAYADMDRNARMDVGLHFLSDDLNAHQFPNFASEFGNPANMLNSSPALMHTSMHNHQGSIGTIGRPTPTPPLQPPIHRNGQALAGS
ncbi:hypothetical protein FRC09_018145, partial [Ceratobasidium sp. 395]